MMDRSVRMHGDCDIASVMALVLMMTPKERSHSLLAACVNSLVDLARSSELIDLSISQG